MLAQKNVNGRMVYFGQNDLSKWLAMITIYYERVEGECE